MHEHLKDALDDATEKLAELPKRIEAEKQVAADEERKPHKVEPFTELDPAVLIVAPLSTLERVWLSEIFAVLMHRRAGIVHVGACSALGDWP